MKKYKSTKITVRTREIISVPGNTVSENQSSICPVCHAPLSKASLTANESAAVKFPVRQKIELPSAVVSDNQEEQL